MSPGTPPEKQLMCSLQIRIPKSMYKASNNPIQKMCHSTISTCQLLTPMWTTSFVKDTMAPQTIYRVHNVAGRMIIKGLSKSPWGAGLVNMDIGS
eukprot:404293-Pelagomonas_calceolata.AAC.2